MPPARAEVCNGLPRRRSTIHSGEVVVTVRLAGARGRDIVGGMIRCISSCVIVFLLASVARADVARKLVRLPPAGENLIKPDRWKALGGGPVGEGGLVCDNGADAAIQRGFAQTVVVNQDVPRPIIATAWSRAENVGGSRDNDYSLYLDILYADGTPLWGQVAAFKPGSHDWQKGEVRIFPTKPIKQVSYHLLLRRHSGKAMFRDPRLIQADAVDGMTWFDGVPVEAGDARAGYLIRDVASGSDFHRFEEGQALGIKLQATQRQVGRATFHTAEVGWDGEEDRVLTLMYTLAVGAGNWNWLAGPRRQEHAGDRRDYVMASRISAGSIGLLSTYPLAAVNQGSQGKAIALDMGRPAIYRVGYNGGTGELYIAFDVALTREQRKAALAFCTFTFEGSLGFRGAVAGLYENYPECFRSRIPRQGLWMPFHKISDVQGWEDFGFRFKEGDNETAWDDAHDIITFRYTEPMTWWMKMSRQIPHTHANALAEATRLAAAGDAHARALLASGYHNENGQFVARLLDTPWCYGAVWSMNSSPGIGGDATDFRNKWNPELRKKLYSGGPRGNLDGEYIDSSEGYVTDELDFNRGHFAAADTPLTYSTDTRRPAVFRGLIAFEYARAIARDVRGMGKLMMANSTPTRLCWLAPQLDVMGTETDWNPGNTWRPMSDDDLLYRRILCGPKPYCFLMNTRFERFSHAHVEKYMKRCLAYGMFPGFFSHNASEGHYFSQPALYNRDRDLFRKYVPLCRMVAEAGWRPVTGASDGDTEVYVERFGERHLTVFNNSRQKKEVTIQLKGIEATHCRERVSGKEVPVNQGQLGLILEAEDVAVLEFSR